MSEIAQDFVCSIGTIKAVATVAMELRYVMYRLGLDLLAFSGLAKAATPFTGGIGAILTLHHVRPARSGAFQPNGILEITPEFLDTLLTRLAETGLEFISLVEARARILAGNSDRRFVCLTFDDGYRDNMRYAQPILQRHGVPWTLFVATDFADGTGELWWLALEAAIAGTDSFSVDFGAGSEFHDCSTEAAKETAYRALYWNLRARSEPETLAIVRELAIRYGIDIRSFCRELCMGWDELRVLVRDPLVSIGAHTVSHPRLATLPPDAAESEMRQSRDIIAQRLGAQPTSLAYPVGDPGSAGDREFRMARELGFDVAVTTRPGVITESFASALLSLPRISLNGLFQKPRYVEALLSGLPFLALKGFRAEYRPSTSSE